MKRLLTGALVAVLLAALGLIFLGIVHQAFFAPKDVKIFPFYGRQNEVDDFSRRFAKASSLTLYEGLPYQREQREIYATERAKPGVFEIEGWAFYPKALTPSAEEAATLQRLLGPNGHHTVAVGTMNCGGFHPDYAVEWMEGGEKRQVLLCFGCGEAMWVGGLWDVGVNSGPLGTVKSYFPYLELVALLFKHQSQRPPLPDNLVRAYLEKDREEAAHPGGSDQPTQSGR